MSDDLVARLRRVAEFGGTHLDGLWTEAAARIEQLEAERDAAYKRGLEDAAEIAESLKEPGEVINGPSEWRDGYYTAGQVIAAAIRAQIQEKDDAP